MKQILQDLKNGQIDLAEIPWPAAKPGSLLIETRASLISKGTEKMMLDFGKASWIEKAKQQPDKVKMVLDKVKTDGLIPTIDAVRDKLDQPLALGYSNVGRVIEVGEGVQGFSVGDRVISNGHHAEVVSVPKNLCARVPDEVTDEQAAFTVVASIALQGVRLIAPTLGESIVVTGLGLIGLAAVQILRANGVRVLGVDFDVEKLKLAKKWGAETVCLSEGEDPVIKAMEFSKGRGVDGVLVTASTQSSEPLLQAAQMSRQKGRVVLVGVTGMEINRTEFFKKELSFQVSCSYGPGRYDEAYEEGGVDYPFGYVRWTEQRNFEAILDLMADQKLNMGALISHRFDFLQAAKAYELIGGGDSALGVILEYPGVNSSQPERVIEQSPGFSPQKSSEGQINVSLIGSGNYAFRQLLPAIQACGVKLDTVVSSKGVSGARAAKKFGFLKSSSDAIGVLKDESTELVVIATRHDSHAKYVSYALLNRKHVFVEKPLAMLEAEVDGIESAYEQSGENHLMVGFNRRFSPHILKAKELFKGISGPKTIIMTMNAGFIPADHWTQSLTEGGRRLIGEGCHFIDLMRDLVGHPIQSFQVSALGGDDQSVNSEDRFTLTLKFYDGSMGTLHYLATGAKSYPKERIQIFAGARVLEIDNFRKMTGYGFKGFSKMNLWSQDKGQKEMIRQFLNAIKNGDPTPIPSEQIFEVARWTVRAAEALRH